MKHEMRKLLREKPNPIPEKKFVEKAAEGQPRPMMTAREFDLCDKMTKKRARSSRKTTPLHSVGD